MSNKYIRHIVMRVYQKHEDAITMSKAIADSLSKITSVHQFHIGLNVGSAKTNCNIVVFTEFENDDIYDEYNKDPGHKALGPLVQSFGYPIGFEGFDYYVENFSNYEKNPNDKSVRCLHMYNWENDPTININEELSKLQDLEYVNDVKMTSGIVKKNYNKFLLEYTVNNLEDLEKHKADPKYVNIMQRLTDDNISIAIIEY